MSESKKTLAFVVAAVVLVATAYYTNYASSPKSSAEFELVGKEFFEEFKSSDQARSLEVAAFDEDGRSLQTFKVKNVDGMWRIPTQGNYPAEAATRLASTASSVMGLERESLASRFASDHERFGVVDPLSDEIEDPTTAGKRLTLRDEQDDVLCDLIIGKQAGEEAVTGAARDFSADPLGEFFYVRRPDENETYKVRLDLELSTRFSDWIEPDLLRVEASDLVRVFVDNYEVRKQIAADGTSLELAQLQGDKLQFTRPDSSDPWKLDGLNPEVEELNTARVNEITSVLDEIKIVGVRPKMKYKDQQLLTADLQLNQIAELDADKELKIRVVSGLQEELDACGFSFIGDAANLALISNFGELNIGTSKGVAYKLHIGNAVADADVGIKIGGEESGSESGEPVAEPDAVGADKPTELKEEGENRYLMVRVSFDESLIPNRPVAPKPPVEPVKPEGYQPAPEANENETAAKSETPQPPSEKQDQDAPPRPRDDKPKRNPLFVDYDLLMKDFERNTMEYELAMTKFNDNSKAFAAKVEEGKALVNELNQRFGEWYYVISAANLNTLKSKREEVVSPKQPSVNQQPGGFPGFPGGLPPNFSNQLPNRPNLNIDIPKEVLEDMKEDSTDQGKDEKDSKEKGDQAKVN